MKKIISVISALLAIVTLAQAQEIYDLKRCLSVGLEQNYSIKISKNEQQISENNYTIGNAGFLPSLDLSGRYSGTLNDTKTESATTGTTTTANGISNQTYNAGLNLTWAIFNGFSVQTTYKRLRELQQLGELNARLSVENLIATLTAEYYNNILQRNRFKNLKYAVDISMERVRIVRERYLLGQASRLDLQQARVDFNADSSRLMTQSNTLISSGITLNELMAVADIHTPIRIVDSVVEVNNGLVEADLKDRMLNVNASLLIAEQNKTISELDYKLVQSRVYPYLNLNTGYGYTYNTYGAGSTKNQQTMGLSYGVTLGFNIFNGFNQRRNEKNAQIAISTRDFQRKNLELVLTADLAAIYNGYKNNLELLRMEKQNLHTAKDNLEIAMERYKLGNLSGIELREAQKSYLDAEDRFQSVAFQTKLAEISLMQISGRVMEYL